MISTRSWAGRLAGRSLFPAARIDPLADGPVDWLRGTPFCGRSRTIQRVAVGTFRKLELRSCHARLHLEPKVEPMLLQSTLVCPHCSVAKTETMPTHASQ